MIPNGVDPEEFANRGSKAIGFGRYILGVGRLVPQKGFDVLLEAFAITELPGTSLVIAGEGFERDALVRRAAKLGIVDRVHLVGAVGPRTVGRSHAWRNGFRIAVARRGVRDCSARGDGSGRARGGSSGGRRA